MKIITVIFLLFSASAWATLGSQSYAGIDLQQRQIIFGKNYGKEAFAKRGFQNNVYVGYRLSDFFGLEVGYQSSQKELKTTVMTDSQYILGQWFAPDPFGVDNNFIAAETTVRMQGPHLNVIGFMPIYKDKTELIASAGITSLTVKLQYRQLNALIDSVPEGGYTAADIAKTTNIFSSKRIIPRLMMGVQHRFMESIGVRATLGYELTGRFKQMASKNPRKPASTLLPGNGALRASLRNSITYGLGVFMSF